MTTPPSNEGDSLFVYSDSDPHTATEENFTTDPELEDYDDETKFVVHKIVAERQALDPDTLQPRTEWLTLWRGWKEADATWEPYKHFDNPEETIGKWEVRKAQEAAGEKRPYDLNRWKRLVHNRLVRRERKAQLAQAAVDTDGDDSTEDEPLIKRRKPNPSNKRHRVSGSDDSSGRDSDGPGAQQRKGRAAKRVKYRRPASGPVQRFEDFDDEDDPEEPVFDPASSKVKKDGVGVKKQPRPSSSKAIAGAARTVKNVQASAPPKKVTRMINEPPQASARPATASAQRLATSSSIFKNLAQQHRVNKARSNYEPPPPPGPKNLLAKRSVPTLPSSRSTLDVLNAFDEPPTAPAPSNARPTEYQRPQGTFFTPDQQAATQAVKAPTPNGHVDTAAPTIRPHPNTASAHPVNTTANTSHGALPAKPAVHTDAQAKGVLPAKSAVDTNAQANGQANHSAAAPTKFEIPYQVPDYVPAQTVYSDKLHQRNHVTCRRWLRNECHVDGCKFSHEMHPEIATKQRITCRAWLEGDCPHSDAACHSWHLRFDSADGKVLSTSPGLRPNQVFDARADARSPSEHTIEAAAADDRSMPSKKSGITCRFWYNGGCRYGSTCKNEHSCTPYISQKLQTHCLNLLNKGHCREGDLRCNYNHDGLHKGPQPKARRNKTCMQWLAGACEDQDSCDMWHVVFDPRIPVGCRPTDSQRESAPTKHPVLPVQTDVAVPSPLSDSGVINALVEFVDTLSAQTTRRGCKFRCYEGHSAAAEIIGKGQTPCFRTMCAFSDVPLIIGPKPIEVAFGLLSVNEGESDQVLQDLNTSVRTNRAVCFLNENHCLLLAQRTDPHAAPIPAAFMQFPGVAFEIIRIDPSLSLQPNLVLSPGPLSGTALEQAQGRLFRRMAEISERPSKRAALLIFPPEHVAPDRILIEMWLEQAGVKVIDIDQPQAWKKHLEVKQSELVVLYHPTMTNFGEMSGLLDLLLDSRVRHFELHFSGEEYRPRPIFPRGEAILLTDHVMRYRPQDALTIIEVLQKRLELGSNIALAIRPSYKDFFFDCMDQNSEQSSQYISMKKRIDEASARWPDAFVELPALDEKVYSREWEQDQEAATRSLVAAFATWTYGQRARLRRFIVMYSPAPSTASKTVGAADVEPNITTPDSLPSERPEDNLRKVISGRYAHMRLMSPSSYIGANKDYLRRGSKGQT